MTDKGCIRVGKGEIGLVNEGFKGECKGQAHKDTVFSEMAHEVVKVINDYNIGYSEAMEMVKEIYGR